MHKRLIPTIVILTFLISSCGVENKKETSTNLPVFENAFSDHFLSQVHTHKDLRDSNWLIKNLSTTNKTHLSHIFDALASCKDSTSLIPILERAKDQNIDEDLFASAMNAIANLPSSSSISPLIESLNSTSANNREAVLKAIGSIGNIDAHEFLLSHEISPGTMHGLYRSYLKGNKDIQSVEKAVLGIQNSHIETRFWSAHLLSRQRENDLTPHFDNLMKAYTGESDIETKIALARTFGKVLGNQKSKFLNEQLNKETNSLVLVNLIRSLDEFDFSETYKSVLNLVSHIHEQVGQTALTYLENNYNTIIHPDIIILEENVKSDMIKAGLFKLIIKKEGPKSKVFNKVISLFARTENDAIKNELVKIMALSPENKIWVNDVLLNEDLPVLQGVAHQCLLEMSKGDEKNELIDFGLQSSNVALICQSAAALREEASIKNKVAKVKLIDQMTTTLDLPKQLEAFVELRKTKAHLTGETIEDYIPEYNHPLEWKTIAKLPTRPIIEVTTTKGVIQWELYLDKIPGAVSTIVNLIDSGYYNNKIFHRIVPNFVAQGGCPRGDGWGSLDFSLRSEYSNSLDYKTGAIGLASAGENTESCQFFMCHSATPHLDDRYTVIGYVTIGLGVLNDLGLGDKILSMKRIN